MSTTSDNYCLILAGGKGRRLWPCSREARPKQFLDFFGTGRTQLQQTYDRMRRMLPADHIYINTNRQYLSLVREQLPGVAADHIMAEPVFRGTAPSLAWACFRLWHLCPDASVLVTPSDQLIRDEEAYYDCMERGFRFVGTHDGLLTLGMRPTRAEPGYGYIQAGEEAESGVYAVQSFTEKPDRDFARMFMESGEFYWNTGLFLANVRFLFSSFSTLLPRVLRRYDEAGGEWTLEGEERYVEENFPSYPNLSIDRGILEKSEHVYVMHCDFGWADVGTWHSIYEALQRREGENVVIDSDVMAEDARGNIIRLPRGRLAVIGGLSGYIVAEQDNVLLICRREDSSAMIRKLVNEVQIKRGDEFV